MIRPPAVFIRNTQCDRRELQCVFVPASGTFYAVAMFVGISNMCAATWNVRRCFDLRTMSVKRMD